VSERDARHAAARAQEELYVELRRERARRAELEREVAALRASTSFRFGQALALSLRGVARRETGRAALAGARRMLRRAAGPAPVLATDAAPEPPRTEVVAFLSWGLEGAELERVADRIGRLHLVLGDFEPLVILDALDPEPVRRRGLRFEYVVGLREWRRHRPAHDWGRYLTRRLGALADVHRPRLVVALEDASGPGALEQGVLDALVVPSLADTEDNLFAAARPEPPRALAEALLAESARDAPVRAPRRRRRRRAAAGSRAPR